MRECCRQGKARWKWEVDICHKNACLIENVLLSPLPQLQRLFCVLLLAPWPFSSYRSTKGRGARSRTQKSRFRFGKGERTLHFLPFYNFPPFLEDEDKETMNFTAREQGTRTWTLSLRGARYDFAMPSVRVEWRSICPTFARMD